DTAAAAPLRTSAPGATMPPRQPPGRQGLLGRMGRGAAAAVSAVILVLVIVGVIIFTQGGGGSRKAKSTSDNGAVAPTQTSAGTSKKQAGQTASTASRSQTTVSVLNGTTTPGLASNISDQLQRGGFKRGSVTNAADQQRPETLVNYAPGFKRAGDEIARLLKLKTVQPIDPGTQAIAGPNAQVVVTVGTDRTQ
ncbi:MAG: LytR C-terminal domain-containing protein, partial [Actinomycetota bacterium]|nr:LytR C-terminal domain-containing protein [Actinomycetota bacterium]